MQPSFPQKKTRWIFLAALVGVLAAGTSWAPPVSAHAGHAGATVEFIKKRQALKALLPAGARISKRKQRLDEEVRAWAERTYGVELPKGVHTFYLARDRSSGAILGGALVQDESYRHGKARVAIGLDSEGRLTGFGVIAASKKYTVDFADIGHGMLDGFTGLSLEEAERLAQERWGAETLTARKVAEWLRRDGALLTALLRQARNR